MENIFYLPLHHTLRLLIHKVHTSFCAPILSIHIHIYICFWVHKFQAHGRRIFDYLTLADPVFCLAANPLSDRRPGFFTWGGVGRAAKDIGDE